MQRKAVKLKDNPLLVWSHSVQRRTIECQIDVTMHEGSAIWTSPCLNALYLLIGIFYFFINCVSNIDVNGIFLTFLYHTLYFTHSLTPAHTSLVFYNHVITYNLIWYWYLRDDNTYMYVKKRCNQTFSTSLWTWVVILPECLTDIFSWFPIFNIKIFLIIHFKVVRVFGGEPCCCKKWRKHILKIYKNSYIIKYFNVII